MTREEELEHLLLELWMLDALLLERAIARSDPSTTTETLGETETQTSAARERR